MAATAGASGVRAWLQAQHLTWLTPARMRAVTIALLVAAFAVSSVSLSSSTKAAQPDQSDAPPTVANSNP